jgi:nucleoside-diphosphate-sugar epimerase
MAELDTFGVLGATSFVGESVLERVAETGRPVLAFSRKPVPPAQDLQTDNVRWLQLTPDLLRDDVVVGLAPVLNWICICPIWAMTQLLPLLKVLNARRVVIVSTTSRFTKANSSSTVEQAFARSVADAEAGIEAWAKAQGVEWIILRPTLIYGRQRDVNLNEIARIIRKFGFFPLMGQATGKRQPIHADDVAQACVLALAAPVVNRAYNISGGETLSYREMVERIFRHLGRNPRLLPIPLFVFKAAIQVMRLIPRYRSWTASMAERMNQDLVFDHSEAARDLGFAPRKFTLSEKEIAL